MPDGDSSYTVELTVLAAGSSSSSSSSPEVPAASMPPPPKAKTPDELRRDAKAKAAAVRPRDSSGAVVRPCSRMTSIVESGGSAPATLFTGMYLLVLYFAVTFFVAFLSRQRNSINQVRVDSALFVAVAGPVVILLWALIDGRWEHYLQFHQPRTEYYSIMARLPSGADVSEDELRTFFSRWGDVVAVVRGWSVHKQLAAIDALKMAEEEEEEARAQGKAKAISKAERAVADARAKLAAFAGVSDVPTEEVFVTFETTEAAVACESDMNPHLFRYLYRALCCCCCGCVRVPRLPGGQRVVVKEAPPPESVLWENIGRSASRKERWRSNARWIAIAIVGAVLLAIFSQADQLGFRVLEVVVIEFVIGVVRNAIAEQRFVTHEKAEMALMTALTLTNVLLTTFVLVIALPYFAGKSSLLDLAGSRVTVYLLAGLPMRLLRPLYRPKDAARNWKLSKASSKSRIDRLSQKEVMPVSACLCVCLVSVVCQRSSLLPFSLPLPHTHTLTHSLTHTHTHTHTHTIPTLNRSPTGCST
eukprot:PLAT13712.2.p1 GENE.PLAT13712.2~~PLAT13712.2.p1  ORF type:complete len:531 (-),score=142.86 PLAT13712.2:565-2157(-)